MDVQRHDELDDRVDVLGGEAAPLDLEPPIVVGLADPVGVELPVASVVERDAADERLERDRRPVAPPRGGDGGCDAGVLRLGIHDGAGLRAKHG